MFRSDVTAKVFLASNLRRKMWVFEFYEFWDYY